MFVSEQIGCEWEYCEDDVGAISGRFVRTAGKAGGKVQD